MSERLDTIQRRVDDMLSVVRHVQEAVDRQKTDSRVVRMDEAHRLLQKISLAMNTQAGELRRMLADRGALDRQNESVVDSTVSTMKEVVSSTLGQAAGIIGMVRPDKVSLMLRDDYTAMNMTAIAYTMLHTTAAVLHDDAVADLAANHLQDITPLIIEINEVVPRIVALELMDDAEQVDLTAVDQAIITTQAAWTADHVHMGHQHPWDDASQTGQVGTVIADTGEKDQLFSEGIEADELMGELADEEDLIDDLEEEEFMNELDEDETITQTGEPWEPDSPPIEPDRNH